MFVSKFWLFLVLIFIISCKDCVDKNFTEEGQVIIFDFNSKKSIANFYVEIADNDYRRRLGLMHKECLKSSHGMLFTYNEEKKRRFWMNNTSIGLDIVFLDRTKKIISIKKNATPFSREPILSIKKAKYVLEINEGLVEKNNIKVNDFINIIDF